MRSQGACAVAIAPRALGSLPLNRAFLDAYFGSQSCCFPHRVVTDWRRKLPKESQDKPYLPSRWRQQKEEFNSK
jgi:hypothetical protein